MALLFWDSFKHYDTGDLLEKYSSQGADAGSSQAIGNYGVFGNALRIIQFSSGQSRLRGPIPGSPSTVIMGMRFKIASLPGIDVDIFHLMDGGTTQLKVRLLNDGALRLYRGTTILATSSAGVLASGEVGFLEIKAYIHDSSGTAEVRKNETTVINFSGDTRQAGATVSQFQLGGTSSQTSGTRTMYYEDLYVCDNSGAQCNDFLGDSRIFLLGAVDEAAHTDFTPLGGGNRDDEIDDGVPDDDTSYNSSSTAGHKDTFTWEDLPTGVTGTIHAVCAVISSRKDDAGTRTLRPIVRRNGSDHNGASVNIGDSFRFHNMHVWHVDPDDSNAWTKAEVDGLELGYELVA